jgi:uroporphyrinogen decarboxylase
MTHRERILAALNHQAPDRLPMDLGSARFTGMVKPAYERLCRHLGFGELGPLIDQMQQLHEMDERVLEYLDVDVRSISLGAPDASREEGLPDNLWKDEWGVVRVRPAGCPFYELHTSPLAGNITSQTVVRFPLPDPIDPGRFRGLRERARRLHEETSYAVMYNARFHLVHQTQYLRGFEDWYCDLAGDHDLFRCLMEAVVENLLEMNRRALAELGDLVDIVAFGDDIGLQDRPVCSLSAYRKLIRPFQERIVDSVKSQTKAKILYHTCGSVYQFIPDFIDIGIDALNPVQVSARHMDPARLKEEFGDRISFWGGIDSQHLLPQGSPGEIATEVRRLFGILGRQGGWVLAAVHNIQPDVSPENVLAMFEAGRQCVYEEALAPAG